MSDLILAKIVGPGPTGDADDTRENVLKTTPRGFALVEFTDLYGEKCRLQKSSLASQDAIWLGVSDAKLKVLLEGHGFQEVPLDLSGGKFSISSSMHLSRVMAARLLPYLKTFVETGELEAPLQSSEEEEGRGEEDDLARKEGYQEEEKNAKKRKVEEEKQ